MILRRELLRAYVTKTIAHGERFVITRTYMSDGTIRERKNPGHPDDDDMPWSPAGRFDDLEGERQQLIREGWSIESSDSSERSTP